MLEVPHCHEELVHIDPTCGQGTRRVTDKASTSAIRKVGTRRTRVVRVEHFEEEGHLVLDATSSLSCSVLVLEWKEPPWQRTRKRQREHEGERRRENEKARTEKGEEERATGEPLWPSWPRRRSAPFASVAVPLWALRASCSTASACVPCSDSICLAACLGGALYGTGLARMADSLPRHYVWHIALLECQ